MIFTIFLSIYLVLVLLLFAIITSAFIGFVFTRVPYIRSNTRETMALLGRITMDEGATFFDLGSGDGRVVFLAEELHKVQGVGFEMTIWTHYHALLKKRWRNSKAMFYRKNFFLEPWFEADVIYAFLYPPLMGKVEKKFLNECRPGAILICRDFPLPNLEPVEVVDFKPPHNAYIYRKI